MLKLPVFKTVSLFPWILFFGYLSLLLCFNIVDIYHTHFFSTGPIVIFYNLTRTLFIPYLIWIFYAAGYWFAVLACKNVDKKNTDLDSLLLCFFAGVGIWHILLLMIGFGGLYHRYLIYSLTIILFLSSLPKLDTLLKKDFASLRVCWIGCALLCLPIIGFVMIKGLYPAGGHDYYNHYFHFYRKVIESGSILPNEIWYQFYYSKGVGLFFLSMLLTDPLAPQLASTAMMFAGAGILFSILRTNASWRLLPWVGVSLYFAMMIYTPGPYENMRQGGWGDLEKPHEPAAVLILAIIWLTMHLFQAKETKLWGLTLSLTLGALVLISQAMAFVAAFYLGGCLFVALLFRKKIPALWFAASLATFIILSGSLLLINYWLTGLPQDQAILSFESIINFEKIKDWGVLLNLLMLHWATTGMVANQVPLTPNYLLNILTYLRLDVWWPLLIPSLIFTVICFCFPKWRRDWLGKWNKIGIASVGGFLLAVIILAPIIGRDQPISFYRFTTFSYATMLCFCLLLASPALRHWLIGIALIAVFSMGHLLSSYPKYCPPLSDRMQKLMVDTMGNYQLHNIIPIKQNAKRFIEGKYSIADAYQHQEGWPGRMPWGGIYPAVESIWKLLPRGTPIWSMHIHSYCMLPDCCVEGNMTHQFTPQAERVFFAEPAAAKAYLKANHLNYFFYSNALQLTDPLPNAPLFSPQYIANYLGIAWTDGENYLLTWKEQASLQIDVVWLKKYTQAVRTSPSVISFPYQAMQTAIKQLNSDKSFRLADMSWYHAGWR